MKRMASTIDGSPEAWNRRSAAERQRWQSAEERWRAIGLRAGEIQQVRELLFESRQSRMEYEDRLRDVTEVRQSPVETRDVRRRRKVLREALTYLETDRDRHSQPLWRGQRFDVTRSALRLMLQAPEPPKLPAHRPGEEWVRPFVMRLARRFHRGPDPRVAAESREKAGMSFTAIITAVHAALVLAGHGDVIGRETIRHILRAAQAPNVDPKRRQIVAGPKPLQGGRGTP